jgi:hypothetical protein
MIRLGNIGLMVEWTYTYLDPDQNIRLAVSASKIRAYRGYDLGFHIGERLLWVTIITNLKVYDDRVRRTEIARAKFRERFKVKKETADAKGND